MRTRIISAFPGTGKSHFVQNHLEFKCLDSDSKDFSWVFNNNREVIRHPEFPHNYIQHIKDNIGAVDFIFISTHSEVREWLLHNCIFFYLFYPDESKKEIYLQRYKDRGSSEDFIKLIGDNWEKWIKSCEDSYRGCNNVRMTFPFLDKEIKHLIALEGGDEL